MSPMSPDADSDRDHAADSHQPSASPAGPHNDLADRVAGLEARLASIEARLDAVLPPLVAARPGLPPTPAPLPVSPPAEDHRVREMAAVAPSPPADLRAPEAPVVRAADATIAASPSDNAATAASATPAAGPFRADRGADRAHPPLAPAPSPDARATVIADFRRQINQGIRKAVARPAEADGPFPPPAPDAEAAAAAAVASPDSSPALSTPPQRREDRPRGVDIESFLGARAAAWVGAVLIVMAAGVGVSLAWQAGWFGRITPGWRCLGLGGVGIGLIATGEVVLRWVGRRAAVGLFASGLTIAYLACWASFGYFNVVSANVGFSLLAATALAGYGLTLRSRMLSIGVLSIVGGYACPILAFNAAPIVPAALPTYLTVLLALALALSYELPRCYRPLRYVAFSAHFFVGGFWALSSTSAATAMVFSTLWWMMTVAESLLLAHRRQAGSGSAILVLLATAGYLVLGLVQIPNLAGGWDPKGLFPFGLAAAAIAIEMQFGSALDAFRHARPRHALDRVSLSLALSGIVLLALAIGLQFGPAGDVLGWVALGAAVIELGRRLRSRLLDVFGVLIALLGLARAFLDRSGLGTPHEVMFGGWGEISITTSVVLRAVAAAALAVAVWRLRRDRLTHAVIVHIRTALFVLAVVAWSIAMMQATSHWVLSLAWLLSAAGLTGWQYQNRDLPLRPLAALVLIASAWSTLPLLSAAAPDTLPGPGLPPVAHLGAAFVLMIAAGGLWLAEVWSMQTGAADANSVDGLRPATAQGRGRALDDGHQATAAGAGDHDADASHVGEPRSREPRRPQILSATVRSIAWLFIALAAMIDIHRAATRSGLALGDHLWLYDVAAQHREGSVVVLGWVIALSVLGVLTLVVARFWNRLNYLSLRTLAILAMILAGTGWVFGGALVARLNGTPPLHGLLGALLNLQVLSAALVVSLLLVAKRLLHTMPPSAPDGFDKPPTSVSPAVGRALSGIAFGVVLMLATITLERLLRVNEPGLLAQLAWFLRVSPTASIDLVVALCACILWSAIGGLALWRQQRAGADANVWISNLAAGAIVVAAAAWFFVGAIGPRVADGAMPMMSPAAIINLQTLAGISAVAALAYAARLSLVRIARGEWIEEPLGDLLALPQFRSMLILGASIVVLTIASLSLERFVLGWREAFPDLNWFFDTGLDAEHVSPSVNLLIWTLAWSGCVLLASVLSSRLKVLRNRDLRRLGLVVLGAVSVVWLLFGALVPRFARVPDVDHHVAAVLNLQVLAGVLAVITLVVCGRRWTATADIVRVGSPWPGGNVRLTSDQSNPARHLFGAAFVVGLVLLTLASERLILAGTEDRLARETHVAVQATWSALWAVGAIGLIIFGLLRDARRARWCGLILLGLVLIKVLTVDLSGVATGWRVFSLFAVGTLFVITSIAYNRLAERLQCRRRTTRDAGATEERE